MAYEDITDSNFRCTQCTTISAEGTIFWPFFTHTLTWTGSSSFNELKPIAWTQWSTIAFWKAYLCVCLSSWLCCEKTLRFLLQLKVGTILKEKMQTIDHFLPFDAWFTLPFVAEVTWTQLKFTWISCVSLLPPITGFRTQTDTSTHIHTLTFNHRHMQPLTHRASDFFPLPFTIWMTQYGTSHHSSTTTWWLCVCTNSRFSGEFGGRGHTKSQSYFGREVLLQMVTFFSTHINTILYFFSASKLLTHFAHPPFTRLPNATRAITYWAQQQVQARCFSCVLSSFTPSTTHPGAQGSSDMNLQVHNQSSPSYFDTASLVASVFASSTDQWPVKFNARPCPSPLAREYLTCRMGEFKCRDEIRSPAAINPGERPGPFGLYLPINININTATWTHFHWQ